MARFIYRFTLAAFLLIIYNVVPAQKVDSKMDSMMNVYRDNFPQEKIYVHFDKNYYNPGETIWFKAYLLSGINLSDISKNLYAELINDKGVVLQRIVEPLLGSSAAANFVVPQNFSGQYLHFRAFTTWMLNFDTSFLFNKNIRIISDAPPETAATPNKTLLQFFPEGGDMVSELESVVAFKANDRYGLPVKVAGYVKTAEGKKVADFTSRHNGMGSFKLVPQNGETYTAVWKDSTNKENTTVLPPSKKTGLVLTASNARGSITYSVKRSDGDDLLKEVHVLAHMNQQLVYKARINLAETFLNSGRIPLEQFPAGVLQITLFNKNWQPMAERVVFVNNNDYVFDTYVSPVSKNLGKRGKNVIEIEIPDTLLSNLSLAVTDATINPSNENEDNIYSRLLLTSDIKGYVYNAGYYFSSFADSVAQQLDLVMLTHGWRRFKWEDLAAQKTPVLKFKPDGYLALSGSILGAGGTTASSSKLVNLIMQFKDSTTQFLSVPVESGGRFFTSPLVFYDTAKVFYSLNKDKRQADNSIMKVENGLFRGNHAISLPEDADDGLVKIDKNVVASNRNIFEQTVRLEADRSKKVKVLQEVVVKGKVKSATELTDEKYTSGLFKGGDGYSFDLTNDISAVGAISLFNYLQGKVAGLTISNAMTAQPTLSWRGGTPDLFLNEMRSDAQALSSISMADIAYIKVFRPPFMGSFGGGGGGAIAVYTKKGGDARSNNDVAGLNKVTVMGYSPVKEFYSPDYTQSNPLNDLPDIRTTLLWQPYIFLDKDKRKITLSFYNNDISKKLRVIVEGVNDFGKLTRVETVIE